LWRIELPSLEKITKNRLTSKFGIVSFSVMKKPV